jgi:hypothetical protein
MTAHGSSEQTLAPLIVKHPGCPQWGLGLLAEERDDKRFYDFEDGLSHSIARPYWSKLQPVELGFDEATALEKKVRGLRDKPALSRGAKARPRPSRAAGPSVLVTFDEEVARFDAAFPGGFLGTRFVEEERGTGEIPVGKAKGKGHKAGAIAAAAALLNRADLERLLESGAPAEVVARVRQVHQASAGLLHPLGDLIPFSKMPADHHGAFATATLDLLYGTGEYAARFDRFVEVLSKGKLQTWPLATVLAALSSPSDHTFVKPSFFEKQAQILGFELGYERVPSSAAYGRMLALAREVERRLREKGHEPRDLVDVYAFLWHALSPPKPTKAK